MLIQEYMIPSSYGDGYQLSVKIKTSQPTLANPIVLTHGKGMPTELNWDVNLSGQSFADLLVQEGYTVILFNALGFGGSSKYPAQYAPANYTDQINTFDDFYRDLGDLLHWLTTICVELPLLVVWSTSVHPGLMVAERLPHLVNGVMCLGTPITSGMNNHMPTPLNYVPNNPDIIIGRITATCPSEYFPTEYAVSLSEIIQQYETSALFGSIFDIHRINDGECSLTEWVTLDNITCPLAFVDFSLDWSGKNPSPDTLSTIQAKVMTLTLANAGHFLLLQTNRYILIEAINNFRTLLQ